MRALIACLFLLLAALASPSIAASGKALDVDPDAKLEDKAGVKTLVVGTDVFIGDRVVTDTKGLVQLEFSDRTRLVVGPRSALVIEDYLLREDGSGGKFAVNALSGSFRFITGGAPKDRYLIKTPTGTIGVRGTALDINVAGDDHTSLLLYHGAVILCNPSNQCVTVDDQCELGQADLSEAEIIGNTTELDGEAREQMLGMFPYAIAEGDLLGRFRIADARDCFNRSTNNSEPDSLVKSDGSDPERKPRGG